MHSMELPSGNTAQFHGDFSGDVVFNGVRNLNGVFADDATDVRIPFEDMEAIVLEKYKRDAISDLEQRSLVELRTIFGRAW